MAVTTFIAEMAARVFAGATITPPPSAADGWITLRRGDRGARVAAAQQALIAMGARLVGGVDGIFGIHTERAVAGFQARRGLTINGQIDAATAGAIGILAGLGPAPPTAAATWAAVARGARGAIVRVIQQAVMNAGIFLRGGADGVFGVYTRAAVAKYQQQRGIAPTGVVDEATAIAMGLYTPPAPAPTTLPPTTVAPTTAAPTAAARDRGARDRGADHHHDDERAAGHDGRPDDHGGGHDHDNDLRRGGVHDDRDNCRALTPGC